MMQGESMGLGGSMGRRGSTRHRGAIRLRLALIWVVLQVLFLAGWAAREESRLAAGTGVSILVRTVPVDPRDFLRGQYLELAFEFSSPRFVGRAVDLPDGVETWVRLAPSGEFHAPVDVSAQQPQDLGPGEVAVRGTVAGGRLRFGIERYFVPEGTATPRPEDITVRLRIGSDGQPRIETVYVRGAPWP